MLRGGQHRFRRIVGHGSPTVVPTTSARSANRPIMGGRPVDVATAPTETHPGRQGLLLTAVVLPPDSEMVAPFSLNGGQLGSCALIVPVRDLTEEFGVVVGHTLVDASASSANVLIINPNAEEVVLPCRTSIGQLVLISAVSVARSELRLPTDTAVVLPEYLEDIVKGSHTSLGDTSRQSLRELLHRYEHVFPAPGEPVTGRTKSVQHEIITKDARPVRFRLSGEMDLPTTDQDETPADTPMITIIEENEQPKAQETKEESIVPPPGFRPFQWPQADWEDIGDATLDPGLDFVASWSARIMEERSSPPPLILLSPITAEDSQDSIVVQVGSPASELYTPAGLDRIRSVSRRRSRRPMKSTTKCEKSAPAEDFLFRDIVCAPAMGANRIVTESTGNRDRDRIPRWRLAREGPFTNERSQASLRVLGKGCAFQHTTYSVEDHAPPEGGLGVPLNHPRFLEWISAPTSAWLLEMSPGQWCDTLSRDQAVTASMQLHKDAFLYIYVKTRTDFGLLSSVNHRRFQCCS